MAHGSLFGSKLDLGLGLTLALCYRVEGVYLAVLAQLKGIFLDGDDCSGHETVNDVEMAFWGKIGVRCVCRV